MLEQHELKTLDGLRAHINEYYRMDERQCVEQLIDAATLNDKDNQAIRQCAMKLVKEVRSKRKESTGIDSFLQEYSLSSDEGIALMCLAEALLRVPDKDTIDDLIKDKLSEANWSLHKGQSSRFFVNAATWALMLTGQVLSPDKVENKLKRAMMSLMNRTGERVIRKAVEKAMRIMSRQFVMGRTIREAIKRAKTNEATGYRYSYDMLGEAALTDEDALNYLEAYKQAIHSIGKHVRPESTTYQNAGISVKLSALHPRYQEFQHQAVMDELPSRLLELAQLARSYQIPLTIDAEESERLDVSLDVMKAVFMDTSLDGWDGFGLAVQSYQKRAWAVLDFVAEMARERGQRIHVRLIKGAYWDSEIKKTQMQGLSEYPVFTRKVFTDVSFQACARKLLTLSDVIYPQFATHNAYSVAMILQLVGDYRDFEFQCLHGMGGGLYEQIVPKNTMDIPCRIYAPVGSHEDLLPYLVRRLLENGANSSFVNRIVDEKQPISELIHDPVSHARSSLVRINQNIPKPENIFQPHRQNSMGMDLTDRQLRYDIQSAMKALPNQWTAGPMIHGLKPAKPDIDIYPPQNKNCIVGKVAEAGIDEIDIALTESARAFASWSTLAVAQRAEMIERYADLLQSNEYQLLKLLCLEAGKTWNDAIAEVREAIDFCRYYAKNAIEMMELPIEFHGYTGERNEMTLHGRGTIVCISPWNFPLAIFTGQIVAALVTGNCVVAKPAEQTPLIAAFAVSLMHRAGVPTAVIQLLPGQGAVVGAALVADIRVKGVVFTGSTETARAINQSLAGRQGEIVPLIAETGGQNCMIVDSSALLEQVVVDVITSAFGSAGQRCSALRVLYVQQDVYPRFIKLLKGAMARLEVGNPALLKTDVGPVIDQEAYEQLSHHVDKMRQQFETIYEVKANDSSTDGHFLPPVAFAIHSINDLEREVFGPVLHVISYNRSSIDNIIQDINQCGYGLTLGIHTRINETAQYIQSRVHVGNCYINRNMTGAVVGLQPFGGEGLSGTGPKAGGPNYLIRFCHERAVTIDTTAAGGNASLMSQTDA